MRELGQWPSFEPEDIEAVSAVLRSGRINQWTGTEVTSFEAEYARHVGVPHAVAVANGTVALELALHALDLRMGDEVIVPCRTFLATATAVTMRHGVPVFADVDRESQVLTVDTVDRVRTPQCRGVIAVHLAGWPCELQELRRYCDAHGLWLVEDCAQAHGARVGGAPVGSVGDIGAFSFCQDKIITTGGEGGMLLTRHEALHRRAWSFKDHGRDLALATAAAAGHSAFRWLCTSVGTNWRMTEMQAALGRSMLRRLADMVQVRRRNADILRRRLAEVACVHVPSVPEHIEHSYYKFYAFVIPERLKTGWSRDRLLAELIDAGIPVASGICPEIYRETAFAAVPYPDGSVRDVRPAERLPVGRELGERSLMFPVHPTLTVENMNAIADIVTSALKRAQA